ncbi:MAG: PAS domain-containing protein [Methanomassiliicoccus sp.]|nr:PAS domain-containing protein [Methanomassiliicoccus sp.]
MIGRGLLEDILAHAASRCIVVDADDKVIYASPRLRDLLGHDADVLIDRPLKETLATSELVEAIRTNARLTIDGGEETVAQIELSDALSGRIYEVRSVPHKKDGQAGMAIVFIDEVTGRMDAERAHRCIDQIVSELRPPTEADKAVPRVLALINDTFRSDVSAVLTRRDGLWSPKFALGHELSLMNYFRLDERPGLTRMVQSINEVHILNEEDESGIYSVLAKEWKVRTVVAIPIHAGGDERGILVLAYRALPEPLSSTNLRHLRNIGAILSIAFSEDRDVLRSESGAGCMSTELSAIETCSALIDVRGRMKCSTPKFDSLVPEAFRGANILSMPYASLRPEFNGTPLEKVLERTVASSGAMTVGTIHRPDERGNFRDWQIVFSPVPSGRRDPDVLVHLIDITEWGVTNRKNARLIHAIREEQYRVKTLLDSVPVGVYISDADGRILEINGMGSRIWGQNPLPRDIEEYGDYNATWPTTGVRLTTDDWPLAKAVRRGETTIGEVIDYRSFDGREGTIINSAAPIRNCNGEIIGAVEIDQDITEMKALERKLEAAKANLEAIINQMPAGVAIAEGPRGRIVNCNNELKRMLLQNEEMPSSIEGYSRWGFLDPDSCAPLNSEEHPLAIALRERRTVSNHQSVVRQRDGGLITVLTSASPVIGKDGNIIGAVAIFTDISHQKEIENRLEKQTRDLAQFNADLQRFAYVTSNELRESLKSINNYLSLIEKNSS